MVNIAYEYRLPTAEDLPDSDETPVDNELQNLIPNLLLEILEWVWRDRDDWYWGIDMGIYYEPVIAVPRNSKHIVPDGFLALGVPRLVSEAGRLSYPIWEENTLPILVLEVISQEYNGEYDSKKDIYQKLRFPYYAIYNPLAGRGKHEARESFELYKLTDGEYQLLPLEVLSGGGRMAWIPEIGLGLGCERFRHKKWEREWGCWYDRSGRRYPTDDERATKAETLAEREKLKARRERLARLEAEAIAAQERQQKEKLAAYLRSLGVNPDEI